MVNITLHIDGIEEAIATLNLWQAGLTGLTGVVVKYGTDKVYGPAIERGFFQGGRLARAAGPARYMFRSLEAVKAAAPSVMAAGVPNGTRGAEQSKGTLTQLGITVARREVPKVSRELESSIRKFGF